jgi:phosphatidylinositol alpha-mannosyltransferase
VRVGIVCPYDLGEPGGVQQIATELAQHLRLSGDSAVLVGAGNQRRHGGPGRDDATVGVGRPFKVKANQSNVPLTLSPLSFTRMREALESVDVVHLHEPLVPLAGWAALASDKPMVVTFHADAPTWVAKAYRFAPLVSRRMQSAILTAVSPVASRSVPKVWGEVRIIPNAIDVGAFDLPVGRIERRIAFLGRDDPRKGLDLALEAFQDVHRKHPETELVVMGAMREVDEPGVRFVGRVSDGEKHRLLASSSIFVAPNTGGESFGIVLAEAMAAGCAVIASDLPAFRAVVGNNGVLVPVADASSLSAAMSLLIEDDAERDRLADAGNQAVREYDWSNVLTRYRQAYEDAMVSS